LRSIVAHQCGRDELMNHFHSFCKYKRIESIISRPSVEETT